MQVSRTLMKPPSHPPLELHAFQYFFIGSLAHQQSTAYTSVALNRLPTVIVVKVVWSARRTIMAIICAAWTSKSRGFNVSGYFTAIDGIRRQIRMHHNHRRMILNQPWHAAASYLGHFSEFDGIGEHSYRRRAAEVSSTTKEDVEPRYVVLYLSECK